MIKTKHILNSMHAPLRKVARLWCASGACVVAALSLASCIDEDLSDCGVDYAVEYVVEQQVKTNLQDEIATELARPEEQAMALRIENAMSGVFTDIAHDIDLSFFDDNRLEWHQSAVIDASSASVTVYMPRGDYRNLALANIEKGSMRSVTGTDSDLTMSIGYEAGADTVNSHTCGFFSSRMDMHIEDRNQKYRAWLYMLNCAAAVVVDRNGQQADDIWGYVEGTASSFAINDSVYSFSRKPVVRTVRMTEGGYDCLYSVMLPSPDGTRADADAGLWRMKVYVKKDGKITENVVSVNDPLPAGDIRIIRVRMKDDGSLEAVTAEVGVSVTLDWKPGGSHDVEI